MVHSVAIAWDQLLIAFSNMEHDRIYFFDKMTGEIFFVRSNADDEIWNQVEQQHGRFLEIPVLDLATERKLVNGFLEKQNNPELETLMNHALSGQPPYVKTADILSFFPEAEEQLEELRDSFLSDRVKNWLEANNLFSLSTSLNAMH